MLLGTMEQSLIFAIMVMGVYISFRILDFPDMTVDGSFPMGAAIVASCLVKGMNPMLALLLAVIGGAAAGFVTGFIHVKFKITNILAGIIVMTGLYSINIKIMGRSNIPLFKEHHLFTMDIEPIVIIAVAVIICKICLDFLLKTKFGFILKALGDNETLVVSLGVNKDRLKIYGLMISNAIVTLAGGLYAQYQGFADVGMGTGTIVTGLASIIIGESIIRNKRMFAMTTTVIIGTIIYKAIITVAIKIGFNPSDLKLITSIIVIAILAMKNSNFARLRKRSEEKMLNLNCIGKTFLSELGTRKEVFKNLNLQINKGEFVTVIGSNGAGKSTLLNLVMGSIEPDKGQIFLDNRDITNIELYKKNSFISKVYQDPSLGTAPSMTVFENLSMADNKGKRFDFTMGLNKKRKDYYKNLLKELGLGIEQQMDTEVGLLSGGQRQCLALLMVTLNKPKLLLLDEHTAALDPKTSKIIMDKTDEIVRKNDITTLMITHNLQDAITYGDRIIMLHNGSIILNVAGEEKRNLTPEKLLEKFQSVKGNLNDKDIFNA